MTDIKCRSCSFRAKYDKNPKSLLGRLWRWHINWCPGWKAYIQSLPEKEKADISGKYSYFY